MIDKAAKKAILEKILESSAFDKTDKYSCLLTYLVKASLHNKVPKEYSIAVDIFHRDKEFDPSNDTIVRYYVYRLRKKLNEYYSNEGKNDKIRLTIPKGHYEVRFLPRSKKGIKFWVNFGLKDWVFIFTIIFSILTICLFFYKYTTLKKSSRIIDHPINRDDPLWSNFFNNHFSAIVLIGDHYLIGDYNLSGIYREHISYSLNSKVDSTIFKELNQGHRLVKLNHGSIPHNSICNLNDIEHVFYSFHQIPEIQFTSEFMSNSADLPKLSDHNMIYMGGFRNLRQLSQIIAKFQIEYKYTSTFSGKITIKDAKSDSSVTFKSRKLEEGRYLDLGLIAKLPGPNSENYLFLVGFAYPAQIETVRMLSRQESLKKLYNKAKNQYKNFPEYFVAVIELTSFEYSAQEINNKYFKAIEK